MNELKIFENMEFGQVRTVESNGTIWFCLADICKALELSNPSRVAERLENDERSNLELGRQGKTNFVNESGLYAVILRSDKPNAKRFRKWITSDVLPSIRNHGMYAKDELLDNPDLLISVAQELKAEREKNRALQEDNERMRPKEIFADAVSASHTSILIGDLAKLIKQNGVEIGQKRLFAWLRENGYLIRRQGTDWNMPTQRSMEFGLFEVKESTVNNPDGSVRINRTTKVSGKGQQYFINKFLGTVWKQKRPDS